MKVAIAGGHGKVAMRLTKLLTGRGDEVISLIRRPEETDDVRNAGADPVICDLEQATEEEVAEAIDRAAAVVFAAGAGPGSGPERKWTMDYGGAVKLIAAATAKGARRYVMVSSMGADPDADGDDDFAVYLRAKGKADQELERSGLDHTIVRPSRLNDEAGTGLVEAGPKVAHGQIPRDDVAAVLAAVLEAPNTIGITFEVTSGDEPIEKAIAAL
jgi:uncharacterized protein YbjT (DUF2867 family)